MNIEQHKQKQFLQEKEDRLQLTIGLRVSQFILAIGPAIAVLFLEGWWLYTTVFIIVSIGSSYNSRIGRKFYDAGEFHFVHKQTLSIYEQMGEEKDEVQ